MIYIGCHLSVTNGYEAMGKTMLDFGGKSWACASTPATHGMRDMTW